MKRGGKRDEQLEGKLQRRICSVRWRLGSVVLAIAGKNTELKLSTSSASESFRTDIRDHHGTLNDGSKASLLKCFPTKVTDYGWGERAQHETNFFPQYVLIGGSFISSEDSIIQAIHYHFENVDCLANGFRTFGTIRPDRDQFRKILEADHKRREKNARDHQWERQEFELQIGEAPLLQYFSGVWEIAKCDARIGSVTLTNRASHGLGSAKGVSIDNQVTVSLEFAAPTPVSQAISSLGIVHGFFELCLGRRQRCLWIEAELVKGEAERDDPIPPCLDVYWSYGNARVSGETEPTLFSDVLIDAGRQKLGFARVLSGWLDSAESVGDARSRIANSFPSGSYSVDRIVGSANAFDLLPDTHVPSRKEVDGRTMEAVRECREQFRALPESFARQSVLSALGRVGTSSLRDKICHRAEIVAEADPRMFAELRLPCTQAVLCRNHFVHGSKGVFDYWEEYNAFVFLADTLEFVFAASRSHRARLGLRVLVRRGFHAKSQIRLLFLGYDMNLRMLKKLINA